MSNDIPSDALRDAIDHVQGAVEFQDAINPEAVRVVIAAAARHGCRPACCCGGPINSIPAEIAAILSSRGLQGEDARTAWATYLENPEANDGRRVGAILTFLARRAHSVKLYDKEGDNDGRQ